MRRMTFLAITVISTVVLASQAGHYSFPQSEVRKPWKRSRA